MENEAVFMTGIKQFETKDIEMPSIGNKEVLVKMEYVGICGSDVHLYERGRIGEDFVVTLPFILGHECSGIVEKVGSEVTSLRVGDKVALEPGVTCGKCTYCKEGRYNLCPEVLYLAAPPHGGALQKYMAYPENLCFKLPDSVDMLKGALIEPLSVALHAVKQGGVKMGSKVVVLGAGPIGLLTMLTCKALGASTVIVTDILDKRLSFAKELGASTVINSKNESVVDTVFKLTDGAGADIVIETAGNENTIQHTAYIVKRGGTIVAVGLPPQESVGFDFVTLINKEAEIKTVFRFRNVYPLAIQLVENNNIPVKEIVTHEFDFSNSQEAFNYVIDNRDDVVKAVIKM